ncbi:hypothetical protein AB9F41_37595, partial [Rhizobium leguminosarum]
EPYASMYGDGAARDRFTLWPPYQDAARQSEFMSQASPEELAFVRSQYGAKLTITAVSSQSCSSSRVVNSLPSHRSVIV